MKGVHAGWRSERFSLGSALIALPAFCIGCALVEALQMRPELGDGAEEVPEAEGRVASDRARCLKDLRERLVGDRESFGRVGALMIAALLQLLRRGADGQCSDWHSGSSYDRATISTLEGPTRARWGHRNRFASDR